MRKCLACGYDLSGHGDEPRCPECGLLNIPEGYRRQVWELVDSGKWFFSGPFTLFRKRPPGWWWALDRPGDLRKSLSFLAKNMAIALLITIASWGIASSIVAEITHHYTLIDINDPLRKPVHETDHVFYSGLSPSESLLGKDPTWPRFFTATQNLTTTTTSRVILSPNWRAPPEALLFALWIVLVWTVPLFVGLITQLRNGLPSFARPPTTIFVAGAYESHRAIYAGISLAVVQSAGTYIEVTLGWTGTSQPWIFWLRDLLPILVVLYAGLGWMGPLRSDYTRQLIRSPFHAGRILVMYAILLPFLLTWTVAMFVFLVVADF